MECITSKLQEMGAKVISMTIPSASCARGNLRQTTVKTRPYPASPRICRRSLRVHGAGGRNQRLTESVYETRFSAAAPSWKSMGANIRISGKTATVTGVDHLTGSTVFAHDLRAGAALVIAGLAGQSTTLSSTFISLNGATRIWWRSSGRWARTSAAWRMNLRKPLGGSEPVQSRF